MPTAQKQLSGKNELWTAYQADPVSKVAIQQELERIELYRYWLETASKEGYFLPDVKARFRDVFIRFLPETAPLFGLSIPRRAKTTSQQIPLVFE